MPLAYVGQRHIHGEILVRQRLLIHDDGHIIKQHRRGQRFDHFAGVLRGGREIRVAMAQLLRGGQVFVAPRAGFRLIPKLAPSRRRTAGARRCSSDRQTRWRS